ncbi:MAG: thiamine pyrophosphate-dependent enzyme [Elusimicrobia bacterium]|nr:thiamine pyrophosphate-dependent enzyme [Candidatus Liberimonas magnetica]
MRSADIGVIKGLSKKIDKAVLLEIFKRICKIKYFEQGVIDAGKDSFLTYQVYLSSGQESIPAAVSMAIPEFMIFAQHRCHGTYLAWGGYPEKLRDELLGLPTGVSGGKAGSNCLQCFDNGIKMFGHHGLIGENVPLGVGAALGSGKPVVCFFGDGAAEEDYVFSAMGFAVTHKLPVLFICEDNNLSILTKVKERRSWSVAKVAGALGMPAFEFSDDPWTIYSKTRELKTSLPAYLNIFTCRQYWHVGCGVDGPPEWDRFSIVKDELSKLGYKKEIEETENNMKKAMGRVWDQKQLQKLLKK